MFVLPNLFTLSSIFCALYAVLHVSGAPGPEEFYEATLAVFFGILFDMADGRVARLTKTQSDFGVQLDSLADVITFGVAPAVIVHKWALSSLGALGVFGAFVYTACGALRLARFNVLAQRGLGSKKYFIGVPIPLAAGVVISLVMFHQVTLATRVLKSGHVLALVLVLSYLMVSNVRYRSFKDLKPSAGAIAAAAVVLMVFTALSVIVHPSFALLTFFGGYVFYGLLEEIVFFRRRRREALTAPVEQKQSESKHHHEVPR